MPIRKEEERNIYGTKYKIRQLPATIGARLLMRITKVFFKGAGSLSDVLQNEQVKSIIESFFTDSLVINDLVLEDLPPDIKAKLQPLKGQTLEDIDVVHEALLKHLSKSETKEYYPQICKKAAFSSTPEFSQILSISGHLIQLIGDIVNNVDPDEFDGLLSELINKSVIRYRPAKEEEYKKWLNNNNDYAFDDHFAGRYNEMIELFVYLILFNYAESLIMLKKNQILSYLNTWMEKLKPKEEQTKN